MMSLDLDGKTVLLTGASSGLGRGVARELARRGTRVVVTARRRERLEEVAKDVERAGGRAFAGDPARLAVAGVEEAAGLAKKWGIRVYAVSMKDDEGDGDDDQQTAGFTHDIPRLRRS